MKKRLVKSVETIITSKKLRELGAPARYVALVGQYYPSGLTIPLGPSFQKVIDNLPPIIKCFIGWKPARVGFTSSPIINLNGADFRGEYLRGAYFQSASLQFARLESSDLRDATFRKTDLFSASLKDANLLGAEFAGSNLEFTDLINFSAGNHTVVFHTSEAYADISPSKTIVNVGCESHSVEYWLENYQKIGERYEYSPKEIEVHYEFVNFVLNKLGKGE